MNGALVYVGWQVDPVLIGGLLALGVAYAAATGPLRPSLAPGTAHDPKRAALFYASLLTFYLVEGSPLHDLAERYLLSAHMLQHLLLSYVVARMMLVGVPAWLWRALLLNRAVAPVARFVLHPVAAFAVFGIFFAVWHVPPIYEGALVNPALHHLEHVAFLGAALILWWPILSPLPELPRAAPLGRLAYLFLIPIAQLPVFASITFSPDVVYATYARAPRIYEWLPPLADQALAGAIMKVLGLVFFTPPFLRIFFEWYRDETSRAPTQRDMRRQAPRDGEVPAGGVPAGGVPAPTLPAVEGGR